MLPLKTYRWTWTDSNSEIRIFDDTELIGYIHDFVEDQISTILGKRFMIVQKSLLLGDYSIVDPGDKKKYAEIIRDTIQERICMEHPKYVYELEFSGNIFRGKRLTLSKNNSTVLELHIPKGLFPERGHLDVFAEDDHALCLYGLFFMNVLGKPKDSA